MMTGHENSYIDSDENGTTNPFKGLYSYEEEDRERFYGRDSEIHKLFRLVQHNRLTVVFGKSGIGKTSLLNAGLFPLLRDRHYLPIRIRLNFSDSASSLMIQVRNTINKEMKNYFILENSESHPALVEIYNNESLWEYFHRVRHYDQIGTISIVPVLIFDQFEELFTIGKNHNERETFISELYCLIEDQIPDSFKDRLLSRNEGFSLLYNRFNVRIVLSIREDYFPHLNFLKSLIPSIDRVTFRVPHLNCIQAREIINQPDGIHDEQVVEDILHLFLSEDDRDIPKPLEEKLEIEPAILSLLCFQIFNKYYQGLGCSEKLALNLKKKIKPITRNEQDQILTEFYISTLKMFPGKVKRFIEQKLLTKGGFRTPLYLEPQHPLRDYLERLIKQRILRKVYYYQKEHIEIIHDILAPIINEQRNRRTKRKTNWIIAILSVLVLISIYLILDANKKYRQILINKLVIESNNIRRIDNVKAIRIAQAAYELSLPNPPPKVLQTLSSAAFSTYKRPVYSVNINHNGVVNSAFYSPDYSKILTASDDNTAKLWDIRGNILSIFKQHSSNVTTAVFSPDGTKVLTASWDGTAKLFDLEGNLLVNFIGHTDEVNSSIFSPGGSTVLTSSRDHTAKLWDLEGNLKADLKQHTFDVYSAVFSPDGSKILTASADHTAKLWDLEGNLKADLKQHTFDVYSAVFSPDGSKILTASADHTAKLWDLSGKLLVNLDIHTSPVTSAFFSPDGSQILTSSRDNSAKLWDLEGNLLADLRQHTSDVESAIFSSNGDQIFTFSKDGTAKMWDLEGNLMADLNGHTDTVTSVVPSSQGSKVLTASKDGTAKIWNLEEIFILDLDRNPSAITYAVFSPKGKKILAVSSDNIIKFWDQKGNLLNSFKLKQHIRYVYSAVFSPDESKILTASRDKTAKLWDLEGKQLADLSGHTGPVYSAVFSPDGFTILTASKDATAKLWNLEGKLLVDLKKHTDSVYSAVFSPDGSKILTASRDKTAKLWDLKGNLLYNFELDQHTSFIYSAVFSPDGSKILTASRDKTAKLWNLKGELLANIGHHIADVKSAVFSPDGARILTASLDRTVKLWDLEGNLLGDFTKHDMDVFSAMFSPDGSRILTASRDGTAKLFYTPEAFYKCLKTSNIAHLTNKQKKEFGITLN
jgi:WD40 repeat protein